MPAFSLNLPSDWAYRHLPSTDSTMARLQASPPEDEAGKEMILLTTDFQTAGRGQAGNSWEAESGKNLLFGLRLHPRFLPASHQFLLSEITALAVRDGIEETTGIFTEVKWPNDIYHGDKKLCGILLTHTLAGGLIETTVIGAGINVNQIRFESDAPNPVSLLQLSGRETSRTLLLEAVILRFQSLYDLLRRGEEEEIHRRYMERLYRREGLHPYRDESGAFAAHIVSVSPSGLLTLERQDGTQRTYAFKEVAFLHDDHSS